MRLPPTLPALTHGAESLRFTRTRWWGKTRRLREAGSAFVPDNPSFSAASADLDIRPKGREFRLGRGEPLVPPTRRVPSADNIAASLISQAILRTQWKRPSCPALRLAAFRERVNTSFPALNDARPGNREGLHKPGGQAGGKGPWPEWSKRDNPLAPAQPSRRLAPALGFEVPGSDFEASLSRARISGDSQLLRKAAPGCLAAIYRERRTSLLTHSRLAPSVTPLCSSRAAVFLPPPSSLPPARASE